MSEKELMQEAFNIGFTQAVFLNDLSLVCKTELRAHCNPQECPNYGHNWVCPPGSGTLEECRAKAGQFQKGILVQSVSELTLPVKMETYKILNTEHNLRFGKLVEKAESAVSRLLPLTSGGCVFCDKCSYPNPCKKPEVKMESLSAYGIDVGELCERAGIPYSFRADRVYLTALLLIGE